MFGEFPAIDQGPRSASVEARTQCLVAYMPAAEFRELLRKEWAVTQALLRKLVMTIRALTSRVYEFSTLAVNNRIQAELLRLANLASQGGNAARIVPAPTHVEIASRVSTHREAVTRELNRLSRMGLIERRGGTLLVKDLDRLAQNGSRGERGVGAAMARYLPRVRDQFGQSPDADFIALNVLISANCHSGNLCEQLESPPCSR